MGQQIIVHNTVATNTNRECIQNPKAVGLGGLHRSTTSEAERVNVPRLTKRQSQVLATEQPGSQEWLDAVDALERCKAALLLVKRRKAGFRE